MMIDVRAIVIFLNATQCACKSNMHQDKVKNINTYLAPLLFAYFKMGQVIPLDVEMIASFVYLVAINGRAKNILFRIFTRNPTEVYT